MSNLPTVIRAPSWCIPRTPSLQINKMKFFKLRACNTVAGKDGFAGVVLPLILPWLHASLARALSPIRHQRPRPQERVLAPQP